jgi:predicted ferric reductase
MNAPAQRHAFRWWLDVALFVALVVLLSPRLTGLSVHEWLGLIFALPVLVHLLLAWPWIATATRRVSSPAHRRDTVNTMLNAAFFVTSSVVLISGLVISQVTLPWLGVSTIDDRVWRSMHNHWTTWMWLSASAHIAMNWRWILTAALKHPAARSEK